MTSLLEAYSGEFAKGYDEQRKVSPRWRAEISAMELFLSKVRPKLILDCPFGTGRWIPQYQQLGSQVIGVDLSEGMLAESTKKLSDMPLADRERYDLRQGSIFDLGSVSEGLQPDLVACIRFLNWVNFGDVVRAMGQLTRFEAPHMIVGISLIPGSANFFERLVYKLALKITNLRSGKAPPQFVHEEQQVLDLFASHGLKVMDKVETMILRSRINYFYLLEKT